MMRFFGRPISSARLAESRADCSIASRVTAPMSAGWASLAFSSMRWVSSSWSSEPQLAPMRTVLPYSIAFSTMVPNCVSRFCLKPTLPGLMRYLSSASAQAG